MLLPAAALLLAACAHDLSRPEALAPEAWVPAAAAARGARAGKAPPRTSDAARAVSDGAALSVTASRDCWLYVYAVDPDGRTRMVVPNSAVPAVKLRAGETWKYPDPRDPGAPGQALKLIATKSPLPKGMEDPAFGGYRGLLRRLGSSRLDWTQDAQAFKLDRR